MIHDRYRQRLFAYTRQMLPHRQDAEDALQDIFVRAYAGLRANHRELALRAWLYRVAHNRCIDELRRPSPPPPEVLELLRSPVHDPIDEADRRESLRRLIADVRRLPEQQRSALLMRELGGMSYADMAGALGVTVPAVKSLLVRARLALGQALEARDTACSDIREELILSHDRGLRPNATARRHMRDCAGCREFRHQLRGVSRRFGAIVPTLGPLGVLANVLGFGGAGSGAAGGALAAGAGAGAGTGSAVVGVGAMSAGATHVATLLAAAVVTAGGAVELQHTITVPASHHSHHARVARIAPASHHVAQQANAPVTYSSADRAGGRRAGGGLPAVAPADSSHAGRHDDAVRKRPDDRDDLDDHDDRADQAEVTGHRRHVDDDSGGGATPDGAGAGTGLEDPTNGSATTATSTDPSTTSSTTTGTGQSLERVRLDHAVGLHRHGRLDYLEHEHRELPDDHDRNGIVDLDEPVLVPAARTVSRPGADRPADSQDDPTIDGYQETLDHEDVVVRRGRRSGLYTFVAVHSTVRGPSLGGCRMWGYADARQALRDALRLSRAMTYKSAVADLPLGGGKGVIMTAPATVLSSARRTAALLDFADTVESLQGRYITAEDVGTSSRDMRVIAQRTEHVAGLPRGQGGSGDPSPYTALGVEAAIRACCERVFSSSSLKQRTVAVVGLGHVGLRVAKRCAKAGARLVVSDIDERKRRFADELDAGWATPDAGARVGRRRGGSVRARRGPRPRDGAAPALPDRRRRRQQPARERVDRGTARGPSHPVGARLRRQRRRIDQHRRGAERIQPHRRRPARPPNRRDHQPDLRRGRRDGRHAPDRRARDRAQTPGHELAQGQTVV